MDDVEFKSSTVLSEVKALGVLRSGRELLMSKAPDTEVTVAGLALAMADARNTTTEICRFIFNYIYIITIHIKL